MMDKIEQAIPFFKHVLRGRAKETIQVSLPDDPEEKDKEKSGTEKIEKAIEFFKQRQRSGTKERPEVPSGNNSEETPGLSFPHEAEARDKEKPGTDKVEQVIPFFEQRQRSRLKERPEVSLENNPGETPGLSLPNDPEVRDKEKSGTDEVKQAIPFFKRMLRVRTKERPEVSLENNPKQAHEICLENSPEEQDKKIGGWLSPVYSQSRSVQLNPKLLAENRCLAYLDNVPEAEAFRVLRTQVLQRTKCSGSNTIMVTSALPGEGKTLAAINLAFTLARDFQHTVLLVDGDLKKQSVHKYLGCASEKGLVDYLADGLPVSELITWPEIEKMTVISGGRSFHESAEILGSPRMKELIAEMKRRYPERYILFDVPPILTGADALTFAPLVDQVIVVVRAGKTSTDDVKKALQFLPKEKILGFVLNRR